MDHVWVLQVGMYDDESVIAVTADLDHAKRIADAEPYILDTRDPWKESDGVAWRESPPQSIQRYEVQ
jgi:hypothetical protein